jgi:hypothetical protein
MSTSIYAVEEFEDKHRFTDEQISKGENVVIRVIFDEDYVVELSKTTKEVIDMDGLYDVTPKMLKSIEKKLNIKIPKPAWWD